MGLKAGNGITTTKIETGGSRKLLNTPESLLPPKQTERDKGSLEILQFSRTAEDRQALLTFSGYLFHRPGVATEKALEETEVRAGVRGFISIYEDG